MLLNAVKVALPLLVSVEYIFLALVSEASGNCLYGYVQMQLRPENWPIAS